MSNPVILKSIQFKTQTAATNFFKAMLAKYMPGDRVSDEDAKYLLELIERHEDFEEKKGAGVSHFEVMLNPEYQSKCFWVVRTDGTQDSFSAKHCVTNQPT